MKRTAILALVAALFSFGASSLALADECACRKTTTSALNPQAPGELRQGVDYP